MAVTFIKKALKTEAQNFEMWHPSVHAVFVLKGMKQGNKVAAIKAIRALTGCYLKTAKDQYEEWEKQYHKTVPLTKAPDPDSIDPKDYSATDVVAVPLSDANILHQPVFGTSEGSIYHVVALGPDAVVAVRIRKDYHIAVRALCIAHPNSTVGQKIRTGFVNAGLIKKPLGHFSVHLEPDNFVMARKCVGSLLFAIGGAFPAIIAKVEELVGAGK